MITTAVIMAAGLGTRFGKYTELIPKGFIEVGEQPMVVRSIETLIEVGIKRIIIGTGYKHESYDQLKSIYPQIETVFSPKYAETNSMYTWYVLRETIGTDDFLLLESDLIYNKKSIEELLVNNHPNLLLAAPLTKFQDQYFVDYDEEGLLKNCSVNKEELTVKGEFVGIHKFSNSFYQLLCNHYQSIIQTSSKLGYEYELLYVSTHFMPVHVLLSKSIKWYEIDDENDKQYAELNIVPFL